MPKSGPTRCQHHTGGASSIPAAARVCYRSVFTASTRNGTLAPDRSGSVLINNTQPGHLVPVRRRIYLLASVEHERVEPAPRDGTWLFLFAAGFQQRVQPILRERARPGIAHNPVPAQRLRALEPPQNFRRTLEFLIEGNVENESL